MAVWIGLRMLWHGLIGDPNTMRPPQVFAVLRLLPSEGFFSVLIEGIHLQAHGGLGCSWGIGNFRAFVGGFCFLFRINDRFYYSK
jgi:hypothetical protein